MTSIIHVLKKVGEASLPIAAAFGVPGASGIEEAVTLLAAKPSEPMQLMAQSLDALDARVAAIEDKLGIEREIQ